MTNFYHEEFFDGVSHTITYSQEMGHITVHIKPHNIKMLGAVFSKSQPPRWTSSDFWWCLSTTERRHMPPVRPSAGSNLAFIPQIIGYTVDYGLYPFAHIVRSPFVQIRASLVYWSVREALYNIIFLSFVFSKYKPFLWHCVTCA